MYRILFILLIFLILPERANSQEEIDPNGYNVLYYPNGKVLSKGNMRNGKPDGYWKTYYTTGVVKSEGNRKNFLLDSVWVFYNSTGDTITKINYLAGKKNGYYYEYNTNRSRPEYIGNIKSKELYVNDIKEGKSYYYYDNGKLKEVAEYVDDKLQGTSIEYAEDGRIITIKKYSKGSLVERQKINRYDGNGNKSGEWREFYNDLKIKTESNFKEGLLHGYYKKYNPQGKLVVTLLYDEGKLVEEIDDVQQEITVQEKKDVEGNTVRGPYVDDMPVGIHKIMTPEGDIINAKIYDDFGVLLSEGIVDREGKRRGKWRDFHENGTVRAEGEYKNNRREGKWVFYFKDGRIEQEGNYRNGKEHGEWRRYYENGNLFIEENFYNGREDGIYREYDIDGNILAEGEYLDGEKEGEWIVSINDFKAIGKYITGLRDSKWKYYYDNGNILFEGNYIQGNADGSHKYYYPAGNIKEEQHYSSGISVKHWKKYDEAGNLIITISYKDGREYRINGEKIDFPDENKVIIK